MKRDQFNPFMGLPINFPVHLLQSSGLSMPHRTGPGRRTLYYHHKRIFDAATRDTPGAERMREVVARRRANWGLRPP